MLIAVFLFPARSFGQQVETTFIIQGNIHPLDSGRMFLMPVNTEDYYPFHGTMEVAVRDGRFLFTDSILYPTAYMVGLKHDSTWKYLSSPFYVEPGVQTLSCNIDSLWETPAISNRTMHELQNEYAASVIPGDHTTLLSYVRNNPGSYVAFWKLISKFSSGYDPFYDSLYNAFSAGIRQTYAGHILKQKLAMGRAFCIGCRFPDVEFASIDDLSRKVTFSNRFSKYTLIDIWFSNCTPCIDQFAEYKQLYTRFKGAGFELIAISTDSRDKIPHWKQVIRQYKLPWPQYLDVNGTVAKEFSIISWPSNFLLDKKGTIIQKNISPKTLELFLNANMSSR